MPTYGEPFAPFTTSPSFIFPTLVNVGVTTRCHHPFRKTRSWETGSSLPKSINREDSPTSLGGRQGSDTSANASLPSERVSVHVVRAWTADPGRRREPGRGRGRKSHGAPRGAWAGPNGTPPRTNGRGMPPRLPQSGGGPGRGEGGPG